MSILFASNERKDQIAQFIITLEERAEQACECCGATEELRAVEVPPADRLSADACVLTCLTCREQAIGESAINSEHWRCLQDAIWSEVEAVQVLSWRILNSLKAEPWAASLLEQMYLEDDAQAWAEALESESSGEITRDSNGTELLESDTVTLIKDLDVKGAGFTAKRGTIVKNISLCTNPEHIEGRVNGTRIVLKTCFLKKA